jgi:hypothetical protein
VKISFIISLRLIPVGPRDADDSARRSEVGVLFVARDAEHRARRQLANEACPFLRMKIKDESAVERADVEPRAVAPHRVRVDDRVPRLSLKALQLSGRRQFEDPATVSADKEARPDTRERRHPVVRQVLIRIFEDAHDTAILDEREAAERSGVNFSTLKQDYIEAVAR